MQIIITTLAEYQTRFWLEVGIELERRGNDVYFLSFDDRSTELIRAKGFNCYSATGRPSDLDVSEESIFYLTKKYGISDLNYWFSHERLAFDERDQVVLKQKLVWSLQKADKVCEDLIRNGRTIMVQELGGFLSVIGCFFAARYYGIDNFFAEPSFFRGRLFWLRNTFSSAKIRVSSDCCFPHQDMKVYISDTLNNRKIVVPKKDRHNYNSPWNKVFNSGNVLRLFQKILDKYLFRKKQEFSYLSRHVKTHLRMLWNVFVLNSYYTKCQNLDSFVYFPLHVPGDMALTLRSPHLLDQLSFVDYLCRSIPHNFLLAIKEHPAMLGSFDSRRLIQLLRRYDNLRLINPSCNNFLVISSASIIVSINSKSGAEAIMLGKKVIVLGDAFYSDSQLVKFVDRLQDLPNAISNILADEHNMQDKSKIEAYFHNVWLNSVRGELYVTDFDNVQDFTTGLLQSIE
jgi:hypothetical protein